MFKTTKTEPGEAKTPHLRASLAKTSAGLAVAASAASSAAVMAALAAVFRVASNIWMAEASTEGLVLFPEYIRFQCYSPKTEGDRMIWCTRGETPPPKKRNSSYPLNSKT